MAWDDRIRMTLIGTDGSRWEDVAGYTGSQPPQGVEINRDQLDGLVDAPIETEWDESAGGIGAVQVGITRYKPRDVVLGFHVFEDEYGGIIGQAESNFRKAFPTQRDPWNPDYQPAQLWVTTDLSGRRKLFFQAHQAPEIPLAGRDPLAAEYFSVKYLLRAGMPLWDSGEKMKVFESSATADSGFIEVSNPTDVPMRHTYRLTRATWTLPDTSWSGPPGKRVPGGDFANRTLPLPPILDTDGGVVLTRDTTNHLHAMTFTGANFLVRMQGRWMRFDIPPYTPKTLLPISYTGAPAGGARAELYQPRLWSRPWGLE